MELAEEEHLTRIRKTTIAKLLNAVILQFTKSVFQKYITCSYELLIAGARGRRALIAFDADHRQNRHVCYSLARLIAAREQDTDIHGLDTETRVVVWETVEGRKDKGFDDAALLDIQLESLSVAQWYFSLSDLPLQEVRRVWREMGYRVQT